jgi:hypothetical protein
MTRALLNGGTKKLSLPPLRIRIASRGEGDDDGNDEEKICVLYQ